MELEGKRAKRLENKKRKVSALLALSELNDAEKAAKKVKKSCGDVKVEETKLEITAKKPLLGPRI